MRRSLLFLVLILLTGTLSAQELKRVDMKNPVVCYASHVNCKSHVPPPKEYFLHKAAKIKTANIEVTYSAGFPTAAKTAFDHAVGIWETTITSSQTIKVQANWSNLAENVLGSAIYWSAFANFKGAQKLNIFYPVALAEKISGQELNDPDDFEIFANFSANVDWYYGTSGVPAPTQFDFVTIVLHEIGHGLGFSGSFSVDATQGEVGAFDSPIPIIYDAFVENSSAVKIIQGFDSPSTGLRTQLTSNNLRINISKTPTAVAQLYAPSTYSAGSSISHLNENSYPAGSSHALMTPQIGFQEVNHDPGSLAMGILSDIGWEVVRADHTPIPNTETLTGPYTATIKLINDAAVQYDPNNVKLNYTSNNTTFTQVTMTPTGNANEFSAPIPTPPSIPWIYGYFISVGDNVGRTALFPGKIVDVGSAETQQLLVFRIGPDTEKPKIVHIKKPFLKDSDTQIEISAIISDNIGIGSASVEYSLNGAAPQTMPLVLTEPEEDSVYTALLNFGDLDDGDEIQYTISAIDNSNSPKTSTSPETGVHEVGVFGFTAPANSYVNNLNVASSDFFGNGFSIATPTGFTSPAIHSDHPYQAGDAFPGNELNLTYLLKVPIRVSEDHPWFRYDEVVLIEPGSPGTVFGDPEFFDYAVVEGSLDLGETWTPLADGYDSRDNSDWQTKYNSVIDGSGNSTSTGTATLYRGRGINLTDVFDDGDEIIIRFRLFSDQLATGWGWAIDNVSIQDPALAAEKGLEAALSVYPNPTKGNIVVSAEGVASPYFNIQLLGAQGKSLYRASQETTHGRMTHTIAADGIPAGVYFVKISNGNNTVVKKVVKTE
jgi:hypothetical protein